MSETHRVLVILEAKTTAYEAALNRIGEKARSVERTIGIGVGAGLATAGVAAAGTVAYLADAVSKASALNETINKTAATFGENTGEVMKFADGLSKMGAKKKDVLDAAASFGLLARGMGQGQDDARKLAMHFTQIAADTESFHNVPFERVSQALRSGLAGEIPDTLKQWGVVLNEETAKAEAVSKGWAKAGEKLTPMVNMMARANLIARGLAAAEGDLMRTQDSWANTMRRIEAQLDNLSAKIGQELIPILTPLAVAFSGVIGDISDGFDKGSDEVDTFFGAIVEGSAWATASLKDMDSATRIAKAGFQDFLKTQALNAGGFFSAENVKSIIEKATGMGLGDIAGSADKAFGTDIFKTAIDKVFGKASDDPAVKKAWDKLTAGHDRTKEEIKRRRRDAKEEPTGPGIDIPPLASMPAKAKGAGQGIEDTMAWAYKLQTAALGESPEAKLLKQIEQNTRPKYDPNMGGFAVPIGATLG